jgi:hypothetical protein
MSRSPFIRGQRMTILLGILSIQVILVVLQLWLLTATMDSFLAGRDSVVVPAALASLGCFALNIGLLRYLRALDR